MELTDMSDLTDRLRRWAISTDAVPASDLMDEAADEIDRLRSQPCPYVAGDTTRYCTLTPLTLTDAEREAVERGYCSLLGVEDMSAECSRWDAEAADTLRGLLERTK